MARESSGRKTQADRVYELLVGQFMDGTWSPGEQVKIPNLSRTFGVSQTPIREALARLEHTGLIRREALKGYSVAPLLSERDLQSLMDARLILEPALTLEAAKRVTPEFLEQLGSTIDSVANASLSMVDPHTFRAYLAADEEFHAMIAHQSANPFLEGAYRSLGGQVQRFRLFSSLGSTDAGFAAKEHRAIYEALDARDADAAAERMREHICNAKARSLSDRQSIAAG